ncbi:MAG: hypothetical protein HY934_07120 [Candidatus Firestonebacteria bacterium]|nr:hypothetical protein [Candidatus Firestonebacteria bacterium]
MTKYFRFGRSIFAVLLLMSSFSCTIKGKYFFKTIKEDFDDYVINTMYRNVLNTEDILPDEFVELNARQFITGKKEAYYSIVLVYRGETPLNILPVASIAINIDGELVKLDTAVPDRKFVPKKSFRENRVWEEVSYKVNTDMLKKIAYAKEIKIKISGEKRNIICKFSKNNFEAFRAFCEKFIIEETN